MRFQKSNFLLSVLVLLGIILFSCNGVQQKKTEQSDNKEYKQRILEGEVVIAEDFMVAEDEVLTIKPGAKIKFEPAVRVYVEGKIRALGTKENPIIFECNQTEEYWRGIKITGLDDPPDTDKYWNWIEMGDKETEDEFFNRIENGNIFEYCTFRNLATYNQSFERKNKWKGCLEAYNTALRVSHCTFEDVLYYGAVLTQRAYVVANHNLFDDITMHKALNSTDRAVGLFYKNTITGHRTCNARCADGIWTKQFVGLIAKNYVTAVADDGIDTDDSRTVIYKNEVKEVYDDGIDIDNGGLTYIIENTVNGVNENGILISDGSEGILVKNIIENNSFGLALRDGSEVVSEGLQIRDNEHGVIIYQNIPIALTDKDYKDVRNRISALTVDEIYEAEYIDGVESPDDLIRLIDKYYVRNGDLWMFEKSKFKEIKKLDPLKKTFKLVGVFDLDYISNAEIRLHPLNQAIKNGLYLSSAVVENNTSDVSLFHDYNLKIEGTDFTSKEVGQEILDNCKCDENHKCEIIDKLNTSGVEINARKIIKRIEEIAG